MFEPFERGTAAGGNATSGTGLGLTIARMLTGLMGGELTVRSTPGVGSCFSVKLYLAELLAWLQERLALTWTFDAPANAPAVLAPALPQVLPSLEAQQAVDELVRLGYLRGIQKKLAAIDHEHLASVVFVARLRALASGFQLDALAAIIQQGLAGEATPSPTGF